MILKYIVSFCSNWNWAFSELYYIREQIYLKQENKEAASQEFKKAVL